MSEPRINLAELRTALEKEAAREQTYPVCLTSADTLALVEAVEALAPVAAGLRAGDTIGTAWLEWPEQKDLDAVASALARFDFGERP